MRALVLTDVGGPDKLAISDMPIPELTAPDQVRVRIRSAALNHLDLFVADGLKGLDYTFPHIVGSDGAGVVDKIGASVTTVASGDYVMLNPGISCGSCDVCLAGDDPLCRKFQILGEHRPGTAAECVVVPARNVVIAPKAFTWAEAAAFPLATLTAWRMLTTRARVQPKETVMIWGAGGGVAQAAIQIAHHLGATVIATSSSDAKLVVARKLGADHVINHAQQDVVDVVKRLTERRGVQVVADSVGQATWERSLKLLAPAGRLVTCGATSGAGVELDLRRLFWFQWSVLGSTMGTVPEFGEVAKLAQRGHFTPVIDSIIPLTEGAAAYRRLAAGHQAGKVVIEVSS